jgi:hypothetical protein
MNKDKMDTLTSISKITDNIYLSGIFPMEQKPRIIKDMDIKYILCCVDKEYVSDIHSKVVMEYPSVTILYLPYNDDVNQNLWKTNKDLIKLTAFSTSTAEHDKLSKQVGMYQNKPLIEIGYHYIDCVLDKNSKILVHCMAGVSRSVSLVVYYLMKKGNMSYSTAYGIVKGNRSIALPNSSFKTQLKTYEKTREKFTERDASQIINKNR